MPRPSDHERLEQYFWELERTIPNPPRDWAKSAKPCKYLAQLKERAVKLDTLDR